METVQFPTTRAEVVEALRALGDSEHQRERWGKYVVGDPYYDDLDLNIHILYDDTQVLPQPALSVPSLLHAQEVPALEAVESALGPMIAELGDRPEADYLQDHRWSDVMRLARAAHDAMTAQP